MFLIFCFAFSVIIGGWLDRYERKGRRRLRKRRFEEAALYFCRSYEYYDYGEEEKNKTEYFKENWRSIYIYRMDGLTKDMGIRDFNLSGYLAKVK